MGSSPTALLFILHLVAWAATMISRGAQAKAYGLRYHEYVVYPASTGPLPIRIPGVHHCPAFVLAGARSAHAHIADESDCSAFYHCQNAGIFGTVMTRKSCGRGLMFNIDSGTCDWPYRVRHLRPECRYEVGGGGQERRFGLWRPLEGSWRSRVGQTRRRKKTAEKKKKKKRHKTKNTGSIFGKAAGSLLEAVMELAATPQKKEKVEKEKPEAREEVKTRPKEKAKSPPPPKAKSSEEKSRSEKIRDKFKLFSDKFRRPLKKEEKDNRIPKPGIVDPLSSPKSSQASSQEIFENEISGGGGSQRPLKLFYKGSNNNSNNNRRYKSVLSAKGVNGRFDMGSLKVFSPAQWKGQTAAVLAAPVSYSGGINISIL